MSKAILILGGCLYCLAMGVLLAPIALSLLMVVIWFMQVLLHTFGCSNPLPCHLVLIAQSTLL